MIRAFIFVGVARGGADHPARALPQPIVSVSSIALFLTGMGMFGAILFIPLFMQAVIGVRATAPARS